MKNQQGFVWAPVLIMIGVVVVTGVAAFLLIRAGNTNETENNNVNVVVVNQAINNTNTVSNTNSVTNTSQVANNNVSVNTNTTANTNTVTNTNTAADPTTGWKTYSSGKYHFSFKYPKNLQVTREDDYDTGILVVVSDKRALPDGSSTITEEYDIRLNPDGYGPQFPYKTWTIEKTLNHGFKVVSEKNETPDVGSASRAELVATEFSANSGKGFRMNFFNEITVNKTVWESTLRNALGSFTFTD